MNETAPKGQVFMCTACGKRARDRYGFDAIDYGYDESCMMHAQLFPEDEAAVWKKKFQDAQFADKETQIAKDDLT